MHWLDKKPLIITRFGLERFHSGSSGKGKWKSREKEGIGLAIVPSLHSKNISNADWESSSSAEGVMSKTQKPGIGHDSEAITNQNQYMIRSAYAYCNMNSVSSNWKHSIGSRFGLFDTKSPRNSIQRTRTQSSWSEIALENTEDYTCVIQHGPNGLIKHKYCNPPFEHQPQFSHVPGKETQHCRRNEFLRFCYFCKQQLDHGNDIYMYSGDKAFCSVICRDEQIARDAESEKITISKSPSECNSQRLNFKSNFIFNT